MSERVTKALWAVVFIALFAAPLHAVVISAVPLCSLCSPVTGVPESQASSEFDLDAGLAGAVDIGPPITGFIEVNLPDLGSVVDTLVEQAGVLVPSSDHPTSALEIGLLSAAPCQNCGDPQVPQEASSGGVHMKGFPLILILSVVVIAIAVPLVFFLRHLRSLEADETYIRERWGVKSRDF